MEIFDIKISQIIYRKWESTKLKKSLDQGHKLTYISNTHNSSNQKQYNIEIQSSWFRNKHISKYLFKYEVTLIILQMAKTTTPQLWGEI